MVETAAGEVFEARYYTFIRCTLCLEAHEGEKMFDFIGVSILILVVVLFAWLTRRAWRLRRPIVKWVAAIASAILMLAAGVFLSAALFGYWKLNRGHDNPIPQVSVAQTAERVARGARFEFYCEGCHAPQTGEPMSGRDFLGEDAPPIGTFYAPNLTPVHLEAWSDGELIRAIREGVHRSGRSLLIMPSRVLRHLSDDDVHAIVAYLRSLPPEGRATAPNRLNVLGAAMVNMIPIFEAQAPVTEPVVAVPPGPTAEYGAYLYSLTCELCHGGDLLGDPQFKAPPLIAIPLAWDAQAFVHFMRSGIRPDGTSVDAETMPWEDLSRFLREDEELRAIYAHLKQRGPGN